MPFPKSDRVEFERNPIKEVICQLKFPAVLRLKSEVPVAFQGAIGEDYPDYSDQHHDQDGNVIQIGINHFFRTKDSQRTLSLGTDFVALSEKSYSRWEIFAAEVQRAQQAVDEVYHPAYYNRVGLRYVDVIDRSDLGLDGVAWGEILNPSMLGFLGVPTIGEDIRQALSMTSISLGAELPGGMATVRHGLFGGDASNNSYFIDIDLFFEKQIGGSDVTGVLQRLHESSGNFIRWCFTDRLNTQLRPI